MAITSISLTENTGNKGASNGYCGLDENQEILLNNIPQSVKGKVSYYNFTVENEIQTINDSFSFGGVKTWSNQGIMNNEVCGITLPFDGIFTKVIFNVGKVRFSTNPLAVNNTNIEIQLKKEFWNNGGANLGNSFLIPLGGNVVQTTAWQEIGSTGKGTGELGLNILGLEGQMFGMSLIPRYDNTTATGIGDCSILLKYEEVL